MSKKRTILDHDPNYTVDGKEDTDAGDCNKDGKYFCQALKRQVQKHYFISRIFLNYQVIDKLIFNIL